MPQAKRKQIKETAQQGDGILSPRVRELGSEIVVVISAFLSLYALLSLLTYNAKDPGWSHSGGSSNDVTNLGGQFGANFSDMLLHGFGYMSYLVPIMILVLGLNFFRNRHDTSEPSYFNRVLIAAGFLVTVMGGCGIENLHFNHWAEAKHFNAGGYLGGWLNGNLVDMFGQIGSTMLMVVLFLTGITIFSGLSWFSLMDSIGENIFKLIDSVKDRREQKEDREIGAKARIVRQEVVTELKEKVKIAPTIMPKLAPVESKKEDSGRMEREKQTNMFDSMHSSNSALPALSLLDPPDAQQVGYSDDELNAISVLLVKKLADFNVPIEVVSVHQGPVITRFEIDPAPGIKAATITGLAKDLARALSTVSVRVVENIPGKSYIGIEIPNESREIVRLVEGLSSSQFEDMSSPLALVLGKDISGKTVIADLAKMPHVLIAGTTGSGKSVCINALILSLIYKATAQQVRMIMVDPKMLELSVYEGIPHLLCPVVTDMSEAANALRWSIVEMERRYKLMSELGVRNLAGYNRKIKQAEDAGEPIYDPFVKEGQVPEPLQELPCLVVIIDELADLMMTVGKKVEELITRLAQKGRASGVHLVLATQRPSVDVITGLLKANIPTRIAFQVSSKIDSRTILDQGGAESLKGDSEPEYDESILSAPKEVNNALPSAFRDDAVNDDPENDPLYDQAVEFVTKTRKASISSVQRQLRVGYNRAARMIETMEATGVVTPAEENGRREVLAPPPPED